MEKISVARVWWSGDEESSRARPAACKSAMGGFDRWRQ